MSENIRVVNDSNFDAEVKQVADKPVFVDFWAPWCAPCRMLGPLLEEAADTYAGKVVVAKYNVDESNQVATENGIRGIPTILVYKNGEIIGYKFVNFGKMMDFIKKGDDANTALEKAKGHYGQWDSAAKYIDPRQE